MLFLQRALLAYPCRIMLSLTLRALSFALKYVSCSRAVRVSVSIGAAHCQSYIFSMLPLELELIQTQITQKPMLWAERSARACVARESKSKKSRGAGGRAMPPSFFCRRIVRAPLFAPLCVTNNHRDLFYFHAWCLGVIEIRLQAEAWAVSTPVFQQAISHRQARTGFENLSGATLTNADARGQWRGVL
jgi:hypothetical protein